MDRREKLEQKQSYCENEAKKNRRIAKHSLDADNKRIYNHRAEVFEQKAEKAGKALANSVESDIIKVGGNNKPRNKRLEEVIHKCIENDNSIFADGLLGKNAKSIIPEQGYYDIVAHGTPNTAQLFGVDVTPEILANILKHREDYKKGLSIRLISCKTGIIDSRGLCFAQRLADILDVDVKAPTETIWVFPSGRFSVGTKYNSHNGRMKVFKPRRRE